MLGIAHFLLFVPVLQNRPMKILLQSKGSVVLEVRRSVRLTVCVELCWRVRLLNVISNEIHAVSM